MRIEFKGDLAQRNRVEKSCRLCPKLLDFKNFDKAQAVASWEPADKFFSAKVHIQGQFFMLLELPEESDVACDVG